MHGIYLKHQPEQEHHSNAGNNICMVLDDELVAHHRGILVGLLSDPHVDTIWSQLLFGVIAVAFLLYCIILRYGCTRGSLLLPTSTGPGSS